MLPLQDLTRHLAAKNDLMPDQVQAAAQALAMAEVPEGEKVAFLRGLADKGESSQEVAAFARAFRELAINPEVGQWSPEAIDIVGTGGDHAGGFNISTLVVLTLASAGVKVMKHGNRGITSKCGSADLFAALGFNLEADHAKLRGALAELGYVFFFAPAFHPAFKHIAPARKALAAEGRRSIFNILGPLVNPGCPARILLGVFSPAWVPRLADALTALGSSAGIAGHGAIAEERGIDEITTATPNVVRGIGRLQGVSGMWQPEAFGFAKADFRDLQGGDVAANVALATEIVEGRGPKGLVDTIVFNTAIALWICEKTATVQEGIPVARDFLQGGAVAAKIESTRKFFSK